MSELLRVDNLSVYYGYVNALQNVSIHVNEGEIITLIGGNGAGKTTTLMSISNLVDKAEGRVTFRGEDITRKAPDKIVKMGISHVPEGRKIFPQLTVYENLVAGTFGKPGTTKERMNQLMEQNFVLFPRLKERAKQAGQPVRGRAADAGHRPGADDGPRPDYAGRTLLRPGAHHRGGNLRADPAHPRGRHHRAAH